MKFYLIELDRNEATFDEGLFGRIGQLVLPRPKWESLGKPTELFLEPEDLAEKLTRLEETIGEFEKTPATEAKETPEHLFVARLLSALVAYSGVEAIPMEALDRVRYLRYLRVDGNVVHFDRDPRDVEVTDGTPGEMGDG